MARRWTICSSTVATKLLVALTGLSLVLYLVVHLAGNLLLLVGPTTFNGYAHALVSNPLIVPVELGLAAIFLIHVYETAALWFANRRARPDAYEEKAWAGGRSRKSVASTTMVYTGLLVLAFVVLHVRTFRYGVSYRVPGTGERDLYRLVLDVFRNPLAVVFYEVALVLVGFHLWHGFSSAVESLGLDHPRYTPRIVLAGRILALAIAGGFLFIPLWVHFLRGGS